MCTCWPEEASLAMSSRPSQICPLTVSAHPIEVQWEGCIATVLQRLPYSSVRISRMGSSV
jgi:hypothetical protein